MRSYDFTQITYALHFLNRSTLIERPEVLNVDSKYTVAEQSPDNEHLSNHHRNHHQQQLQEQHQQQHHQRQHHLLSHNKAIYHRHDQHHNHSSTATTTHLPLQASIDPAIMSADTTAAASVSVPAKDEAGSQNAAKESKGFKLVHSRVKFGQYQGKMMPYYEVPLEVHVPKVRNMALRDNDIVLLTFPKSGTHWTWRILDMLATGSATYSDHRPDDFFLDLMPTEVIDEVDPDVRRVLSTHFPSDLMPAQIKDGRVKVVHVYRNLKAAIVSSVFHMQASGDMPGLTVDKLEAMMFDEKSPMPNQFDYFDKLMEFERDNPNVDIFHLAYEDMKKDTVGCIQKLAAYLSVDASDDLCTRIAEAVSFNTLKKYEESIDATQQTKFYRKGETGDWKNHMTVAQSERIDKALADRAASCRFCRRYCPTITTDQGDLYRLSSSS